jgi:hypothetical protein
MTNDPMTNDPTLGHLAFALATECVFSEWVDDKTKAKKNIKKAFIKLLKKLKKEGIL